MRVYLLFVGSIVLASLLLNPEQTGTLCGVQRHAWGSEPQTDHCHRRLTGPGAEWERRRRR